MELRRWIPYRSFITYGHPDNFCQDSWTNSGPLVAGLSKADYEDGVGGTVFHQLLPPIHAQPLRVVEHIISYCQLSGRIHFRQPRRPVLAPFVNTLLSKIRQARRPISGWYRCKFRKIVHSKIFHSVGRATSGVISDAGMLYLGQLLTIISRSYHVKVRNIDSEVTCSLWS
jgi:hypothetical protein